MKHCVYCDIKGGYPLITSNVPGFDLDMFVEMDTLKLLLFKKDTADVAQEERFRIRYCPVCGRDLMEEITVDGEEGSE